MSVSSVVSVVLATALGVAACNMSGPQVNAERTAACADRTNGVSCNSCCKTESATYTNVCTCKGKLDAPK